MLGILVAAISGAIMSVQGVFGCHLHLYRLVHLWSVYWPGLLPEEMVQSAVCGMFRLNICCQVEHWGLLLLIQ